MQDSNPELTFYTLSKNIFLLALVRLQTTWESIVVVNCKMNGYTLEGANYASLFIGGQPLKEFALRGESSIF